MRSINVVRALRLLSVSFAALFFLVSASVSSADNVNISQFDRAPLNQISFGEFNNAVRAANRGGGGTITFGNRLYRTANELTINRPNVTVRGGSNTTIRRTANGRFLPVFRVTANNCTISRIRIQGDRDLTFDGGGLIEREGLAARTGIERGVSVSPRVLNFKCEACVFTRVNVGIGFQGLPHGARIVNCRFTTARGMIESTNNGEPNATRLVSNFVFRNCDYVGISNNLVAARGIILDFGNVEGATNIIDMRNSLITGCDFPTMAYWNVDLNRLGSVRVTNNRFNGGGRYGRNRFVHCIHLEDGSRNILIRNNRFNQPNRSNLTLADHIWAGGNAVGTVQLNVPAIRRDNTFRGLPGGAKITIRPRRFGPPNRS